MRKQIGWYDPQTCTFFNGDKDDGCHGAYSVPVFADDGKTDELRQEIQSQILENQVAILLTMLEDRGEGTMLEDRGEGIMKVNVRRNLVNMRKRSIDLLERTKK